MLRCLMACCGCCALMITLGCAVCASPHDCKFAAYGGVHERTDMANGRVGSVFDPAPEINHAKRVEQSQPPPFEPTEEEPENEQSLVPNNGGGETDDEDPFNLPELPGQGTIELPELPELQNSDGTRPLLETRRPTDERNPLLDLLGNEL